MTPEKCIELQHQKMLEDFRKQEEDQKKNQSQVNELNRQLGEAWTQIAKEREAHAKEFKKCDEKLTIYSALFWILLVLIVLVEAQKHFHMFGDYE